jgi:amino acid transporter
MLGYLFGLGGTAVPSWAIAILAFVVAGIIASIGVQGVSGSTGVSAFILVVQLTLLVVFSIMNFIFRTTNPLNVGETFVHGSNTTKTEWYFTDYGDVVQPHTVSGILFQASIAILILVGFDSATSMGGAAINPKKDIPRGVIYSLVMQGLFAYLLEYMAANGAISTALVYTNTATGETHTGIDACAASPAPIADLAIQVADAVLGAGSGNAFMAVLAVSVFMAVIASALAAMNTAVWVSHHTLL